MKHPFYIGAIVRNSKTGKLGVVKRVCEYVLLVKDLNNHEVFHEVNPIWWDIVEGDISF